MKNLSPKKVLQIVLSVAVVLFCIFAISKGEFVREKDRVKDADTVESFVKFNLLTHEGMNIQETPLSFSGKDKAWSSTVNDQMQKYLSGSPSVHKMSGDPFVFSYRLTYVDGRVSYVLWFDNGGNKVVGPDTTVDIYVGDIGITGDTVMSERLLQAGETEPLKRGYLVDENMHTKVLITQDPVFLYKE